MGKKEIHQENSAGKSGVLLAETELPQLVPFTPEEALALGAMVVSSGFYVDGQIGGGKLFTYENKGTAQAPFEMLALQHFEQEPNFDKKIQGEYADNEYYEKVRKSALDKLHLVLEQDDFHFQTFQEGQDENVGEILSELRTTKWDYQQGFTPKEVFSIKMPPGHIPDEKMRIVNLWRELRGEGPVLIFDRKRVR